MSVTDILIWIGLAIVAISVVLMIIERKRNGRTTLYNVYVVIGIVGFLITGITHLVATGF